MSLKRPLPTTNTAEEMLGEVRTLVAKVGLPGGVAPQDSPLVLRPADLGTLAAWRAFAAGVFHDALVNGEWPLIVQAHGLARLGQARELIALDQAWGKPRAGSPLAISESRDASFSIGRRQLERLRPLRDQRVVQRYLAAIESGEARGWHPMVYGVVLAVFDLPLRQGLAAYARQIAAGFLAETSLAAKLNATRQQELIDALELRLQPPLNQLLAKFVLA